MEEVKVINDCWNHIGSWGLIQPRCEQLASLHHCINCSVYAGAGRQLLNRAAPDGYLEEWQTVLEKISPKTDRVISSLLLFSIDQFGFALSTSCLEKITDYQDSHGLPHCRHKSVIGLVNITGELMVSLSLLELVGAPKRRNAAQRQEFKRHVVIKLAGLQWVFPVSEIMGIHRFNIDSQPAADPQLAGDIINTTFQWQSKTIHFLDEVEFIKLLAEIRF